MFNRKPKTTSQPIADVTPPQQAAQPAPQAAAPVASTDSLDAPVAPQQEAPVAAPDAAASAQEGVAPVADQPETATPTKQPHKQKSDLPLLPIALAILFGLVIIGLGYLALNAEDDEPAEQTTASVVEEVEQEEESEPQDSFSDTTIADLVDALNANLDELDDEADFDDSLEENILGF